jgi:hypothetical protein
VVEIATNTIKFFARVNIIAEINVIHFINIAHVHITTKQLLSNVFRSGDTKRVNDTQKLLLSNMAVLSAVKVLEDGLEHNTTHAYCVAVLFKNGLQIARSGSLGIEVLASGKQRVVLGQLRNSSSRDLLNACGSECLVN